MRVVARTPLPPQVAVGPTYKNKKHIKVNENNTQRETRNKILLPAEPSPNTFSVGMTVPPKEGDGVVMKPALYGVKNI